MIIGVIFKVRETVDIQRLGGMLKDYPKFSFVVAVVLFSLVGIPPLSGFWPKILLFQEAFKAEQFILLITLILASFVTLYAIARIWTEVFWKDSPKPLTEEIDRFAPFGLSGKIALVMPIVTLAAVSLYIGLNANTVFEVAQKVAHEMKDSSIYINAVLKEQ